MKHIGRILSLALFAAVLALPLTTQAQSTAGDRLLNTVTTAVPFLRIAPDARSGAMGDMSVATSADANGWFWNPAKMTGVENDLGFAITYTPWLRRLITDIYLASVYGFKRLDENQVFGGSLRYFSLGVIQFRNAQGQFLRNFSPNEFAVDAGYSRKLGDNLSAGLMLRFIYSNLASGHQVNDVTIKPGTSVAADLGFHYQNNEIELGDKPARLGVGMNISNVGAKITYTSNAQEKDFIPTNFALGGALDVDMDEHNRVMFGLDITKLMVPTPDTTVGGIPVQQISTVKGILGSFTDAPGGFGEELHEFMFAFGIEYWYDNQFAVRLGHFNEHSTKGNRKFLTVGLGLKYNVFGLDFSYLVPTSGTRSPLDNTLRFSLSFDFDALSSDKGD